MPELTQQQQLVLRYVVVVLSSGAATVGILPKAWADWLSSDGTLTVLFAITSLATLVIGWLKTRPKDIVISAGKVLQKEGGVIVAPAAIADSSKAPDNVVKTITEAAGKVPAPMAR